MGLFLSDKLGMYFCCDWDGQASIVEGKVKDWWCLMLGFVVAVAEGHIFQWMRCAFEHVHVHSQELNASLSVHTQRHTMYIYTVSRCKSYIAEEWQSNLCAIRRCVTSTSGTASITQYLHLFPFFDCLYSSEQDLALLSGVGLHDYCSLQDLASPCGEQVSYN